MKRKRNAGKERRSSATKEIPEFVQVLVRMLSCPTNEGIFWQPGAFIWHTIGSTALLSPPDHILVVQVEARFQYQISTPFLKKPCRSTSIIQTGTASNGNLTITDSDSLTSHRHGNILKSEHHQHRVQHRHTSY
jgi:hypothetical protein